jgi:transcription elongation GreA/GreB family factor
MGRPSRRVGTYVPCKWRFPAVQGGGSLRPVADDERPVVRVGDVVHLRDGELEEWWRIVPADVADVRRRWMSADTPMARAVLGHGVGDRVRVDRPGGRWPIDILAVESRGTE